jgi:hypothetical protein
MVHKQDSESYLELKGQTTRHFSTICSEDSDLCDGKVGSLNREVMTHTGSEASNGVVVESKLSWRLSCRSRRSLILALWASIKQS